MRSLSISVSVVGAFEVACKVRLDAIKHTAISTPFVYNDYRRISLTSAEVFTANTIFISLSRAKEARKSTYYNKKTVILTDQR